MVHTGALHEELAALAPGVLTSHHAHHYRGFAHTQWKLFDTSGELKPLLYTFRVLLTGIHLMRTGELQAHLPTLLGAAHAPGYLPELIVAKREAEHGGADVEHARVAADVEHARVAADVERLHTVLDEAQAESTLPDAPVAYDALHDLVVRARLQG
ncbi:hypothetical protein GCM10010349_61860 [Streptomyces flavofungini]|nr:hypothetical protein GCM10010349_61860 [Streptomyces flavofungini]